tara:strand:- start:99 stop:554 length:456 start_codon:yes stop_codon:yes gene_type:complete
MKTMNILKSTALVVAGPLALAIASPANAQEWPLVPGDYSEITGIDIADGGDLEYAKFVAGQWVDNQKYAISKGWIKSYNIYYNVHRRHGEPSMYLSVTFGNLADAAEQEKREKAYMEFMKRSQTQLETESGNRAKFRTVMGTMLLQEVSVR